MKFDLKNPELLKTTEIDVATLTNKNKSKRDQTTTASLSHADELTNTYEWHWRNASSVGGDAQFKTGIPFVAEGTLKLGLENTFYIGKKGSAANRKIKSLACDTSVSSAPGTATSVEVVIKKHEIHIPFTATLENGKEKTGIFKSVQYDVDTSFKDEIVS